VIPAAFEYATPASVEEAIQLLQQHGDEAKILAGGHSLLPLMKLRLAIPAILVDLGKVEALSYIEERGKFLAIGSMTTYYDVESSESVRRRVPLLAQSVSLVGDMQVRNRGTMGGAAAHSDPAGDLPTVMQALDAEVVVRGPTGERVVPASEFFVDIWTPALGPEDIVTEVRFPYSEGRAQHYEKFRQRAADWAIVGVAVNLARHNGTIEDARVVLTNVGPTPVRATAVESALRGAAIEAGAIQAAAAHAAQGLEPAAELKAGPDYKRHLAGVLTRRALATALGLS
jgi:carbon-monoxide dehydrogenase medium subunit